MALDITTVLNVGTMSAPIITTTLPDPGRQPNSKSACIMRPLIAEAQ